MIKRYALFYPSKELGGAELLLARLADKLAERGNKVTVIDSDQGVVLSNIKDPRVICLTAKIGTPLFVECDYLIAFASNIINLRQYIASKNKCKILFWSIHPLNSIYLMPGYGEKIFQLGIPVLKIINQMLFKSEDEVREKALKNLVKSNAIVCMDGENSRIIKKYYRIEDDIKYLPVPVLMPERARAIPKIEENTTITIAWYGRLCDFKVHALNYIIRQFENISLNKLRLLIIGDGPLKELVQKTVELVGINAVFKGSMPNSAAIQLLKQEAHIVFAMGTAALEAAAMGIPTVLVDASYKPINFKYRFNWLYNTNDYTLGRFVSKKSQLSGASLEEIIIDSLARNEELSKLSFNYVKLNHDIDRVIELVELSCAHSEIELMEFNRLTGYKRSTVMAFAKYARHLLLGKS
jgi:glycosyltransferase involved in cell wall biosynthesis